MRGWQQCRPTCGTSQCSALQQWNAAVHCGSTKHSSSEMRQYNAAVQCTAAVRRGNTMRQYNAQQRYNAAVQCTSAVRCSNTMRQYNAQQRYNAAVQCTAAVTAWQQRQCGVTCAASKSTSMVPRRSHGYLQQLRAVIPHNTVRYMFRAEKDPTTSIKASLLPAMHGPSRPTCL
jgi:hypothetical protein